MWVSRHGRPADKEIVAWDLVNVEAPPYEVLIRGASWEWESFGDYLASVARRGIALNAAFLVPLSALRFYVIGEQASERAATSAEIEQMARLFREAMNAGAYGFSLSMIKRHMGFQGKPLASRLAGKDELAALCHVMREMNRGVIEMALMKQIGTMADDELDLLLHLARESRRPVPGWRCSTCLGWAMQTSVSSRACALFSLRWKREPHAGLAADLYHDGIQKLVSPPMNTKAAVDLFDQGIELDPRYPGFFWARGKVRLMKGETDLGMEDLDTAIRLEPDQAEALLAGC